jgi:hypothetical protein
MAAAKAGEEPVAREYAVTWEIEVLAGTPREAAELARAAQLDPETTATVFAVAALADRAAQEAETIDLAEEEADEGAAPA